MIWRFSIFTTEVNSEVITNIFRDFWWPIYSELDSIFQVFDLESSEYKLFGYGIDFSRKSDSQLFVKISSVRDLGHLIIERLDLNSCLPK
jgi:hypothetical protein